MQVLPSLEPNACNSTNKICITLPGLDVGSAGGSPNHSNSKKETFLRVKLIPIRSWPDYRCRGQSTARVDALMRSPNDGRLQRTLNGDFTMIELECHRARKQSTMYACSGTLLAGVC